VLTLFLNIWLDWKPYLILEHGFWVPKGWIRFIFDRICCNEGSLYQHVSANEVCIWNQYLLTCILWSLCIVIFHSYYHFSRVCRTSDLLLFCNQKIFIIITSSFMELAPRKWFINNKSQFMLLYFSLSNNRDMDLYFVHNCNMNCSDDRNIFFLTWIHCTSSISNNSFTAESCIYG